MADYRNRIIETRVVSSHELAHHPLNWRTHPQKQRRALRESLGLYGIVKGLVGYYSEREGGKITIIDGNLRLDEADEWTVGITDLSDAEADQILLLLDPISAMAGSDAARLDELLRGFQSGEAAVQEMLAELAARSGVYPIDIPDPQPQREPQLESECFIELYCSRDDLADFQATLDEWGKRGTVTINIS